MSDPLDEEEEEWKTVTRDDKKRRTKHGRRNKRIGRTNPETQGWHLYTNSTTKLDGSTVVTMSQDELQKMTSQCQLELQSTKFFSQLQDILQTRNYCPPKHLVCYGIGNFGRKQTTPSASMWQLACALQLRDSWKQNGMDLDMYYFEPLMTTEEALFLKQLSVHVITENEKGRRIAKEPTFFFMPHCPLALYSNLIFANYKSLENVILFGNSLVAYANRLEKNCHTTLLQVVQPVWDEHRIALHRSETSALPGQFEQGFNDSAIIYFRETKGLLLPENLNESLLLDDHEESSEVV